ncbi:hypothetical protein OBBRIDRAFT_155941 [Obba rivulosa]|uniref:Uncharacterized protein n=1 Tax=Obba rivulosa TaxID=1052685 RepID=A0A8E2AVI0_9APHY|nr:hypothetical protein OBBRIDRAFT_155941 [Obba rivulosa]
MRDGERGNLERRGWLSGEAGRSVLMHTCCAIDWVSFACFGACALEGLGPIVRQHRCMPDPLETTGLCSSHLGHWTPLGDLAYALGTVAVPSGTRAAPSSPGASCREASVGVDVAGQRELCYIRPGRGPRPQRSSLGGAVAPRSCAARGRRRGAGACR